MHENFLRKCFFKSSASRYLSEKFPVPIRAREVFGTCLYRIATNFYAFDTCAFIHKKSAHKSETLHDRLMGERKFNFSYPFSALRRL